MVNEKSLKNLKPFEKGQSGNPSGRKGNMIWWKDFLSEMYQQLDPKGTKDIEILLGVKFEKPLTRLECSVLASYKRSLTKKGDNFLLEQYMGKARQQIDIGGLETVDGIEVKIIRNKPDDGTKDSREPSS